MKKSILILLMGTCSFVTYGQNSTDNEKIIVCIESETQAWIERDLIKWTDCWAHLPNCTQAWNDRNGTWSSFHGWDTIYSNMKADIEAYPEARTDKFEHSNYQIQILSPGWAWVNFYSIIRRDNNRVYTTFEQRLLTQIDSNWKLVKQVSLWDYSKTNDIGLPIEGQEGRIIQHFSAPESSDWLIETTYADQTILLFPIGLNDNLKQDGIKIKFYGELLPIQHHLYKPGSTQPVPDRSIRIVKLFKVDRI